MAWADELSRLKASVRTNFATAVSYQDQSGTVTAINAVVRSGEQFEASQAGAEAEIFVRLADLPALPAKYDRATFGSKIYQVSHEPIRDGGGGARLLLRYIEDV